MKPENIHNSIEKRSLKMSVMNRFSQPLECLTAHLIYESSEVLAGTKPANLVSLPNSTRSCGINLYEAWEQHGSAVAMHLDKLSIRKLSAGPKNMLLFCYDAEHLEKHLSHPGIRNLLIRSGYDTSGNFSSLLDQLCNRIYKTGSFPHEIGLFIGYPAKDVAAFMGVIKIPFTCQGPWKIFGNPEESLILAARHKRARQHFGQMLEKCHSPFDCVTEPLKRFF